MRGEWMTSHGSNEPSTSSSWISIIIGVCNLHNVDEMLYNTGRECKRVCWKCPPLEWMTCYEQKDRCIGRVKVSYQPLPLVIHAKGQKMQCSFFQMSGPNEAFFVFVVFERFKKNIECVKIYPSDNNNRYLITCIILH